MRRLAALMLSILLASCGAAAPAQEPGTVQDLLGRPHPRSQRLHIEDVQCPRGTVPMAVVDSRGFVLGIPSCVRRGRG